jgi:hypothetical protein
MEDVWADPWYAVTDENVRKAWETSFARRSAPNILYGILGCGSLLGVMPPADDDRLIRMSPRPAVRPAR